MKRLIAIIAMILAVVPLLGVKAVEESTNYYTYKKGQIVNFYTNANEEENRAPNTGVKTIVLDDKGANDKYVKVLLLGAGQSRITSFWEDDDPAGTVVGSHTMLDYISSLRNSYGIDDTENAYFYNFQDSQRGLNYISLNEMLELIGEGNYTYNSGAKKYTVNGDTTITDRSGADASLFGAMTTIANAGSSARNGFYTSTFDGTKIWVVKFVTTATTGNSVSVTGMTIEQVVAEENDQYAVIGTAYANKTKDCHEVSYMCYVCDTEYKYIIEGTQEESCRAVPNVTNAEECVAKACYNCDGSYKWMREGTEDKAICTKIDTITTEANCVKSPVTGIESHILEFAIVAALCAIALLVVRRRDLFRTI